MVKRKNQPLIDSDTDSSSGSASDLDSEFLSLAKKKKSGRIASPSPNKNADANSDDSDWGVTSSSSAAAAGTAPANTTTSGSAAAASSDSADLDPVGAAKKVADSSDEESADEVTKPAVTETKVAAAPPAKKHRKDPDSEPEEGQLTSDDDDSSSSDSEFNDGYDENLMGDAEDRARLEALSEKERETEIFKRIERRDIMRTRWEIERKLRQAKKAEKAKDRKPKSSSKKKKPKEKRKERPFVEPAPVIRSRSPELTHKAAGAAATTTTTTVTDVIGSPEKKTSEEYATTEYFDPKERSKERKKNVEANKTNDKRSDAMALLKARREGRAKREEEEARREAAKKQEEEKEELDGVAGSKSSTKLKASDIYSDDSGSDSEDKTSDRRSSSSKSSSSEDEDSESKSETPKRPVFISTNAELNKLRLSRYKMERFVNLPHFESVVKGCFVRVSIGNSNSRPVYRIGEIMGVVETAKIYQLGSSRTNKGLRLRHGNQERVFRLEFISNQDFTDAEFEKWRNVCEQQGVSMPTIELIEQKAADVREALTYEFKEEDINRIVEEKARFRAHPTNYAMKKTQLMKERDAAVMRGDDDYAKDLSLQIAELEERANELDKKRSSSISLISYINNRNRRKNVEEAEKAIMEEARANQGQRVMDPFTRRSTQPTMSFKAIMAKADEPPLKPMVELAPPPGKKKLEEAEAAKRAGGNGPAATENNLYSLHDFEIDLDVPLPTSVVNVTPKPVEKEAKESRPKRSLNLEDYKKKRGLI